MSASPSSRLHLQVTDFRAVARDVVLVELAAMDGTELPAFTPGAHLELHLGNGLIRHYSLLNDCRERQRYQLAIGLGDDSRGGARFIHRQLRTGDRLHAAAPRNHFMLREDAARYCFVAGGIGITPILSMVRWCQAQGKDWRLLYAVRERQRAAFLTELMTLGGERTRLHCSDEGDPLDSTALIAGLGADEELYCCGPDGLMQAIRDAGSDCAERLHFERFDAPVAPASSSGGTDAFRLELRRSALSLRVESHQSILEVLEEQGLEPPYACRAGICRTCETRVCAGEPEHFDHVLSDTERASGETLLICVSRCRGNYLELDL